MGGICFHNGTVLTGISQFSNGAVLIRDEFIEDVYDEARFFQKPYPDNTRMIDLKGGYIAPGFIDTHIHGIGGFGTDDASEESIHGMARMLVKFGVTGFLPTVYPAETSVFKKTISEIRRAIEHQQAHPEDRRAARVLGMHLEGPFISPGQAGVQKVEYMKQPDVELMKEFLELGGGHVINMTVAPELKGMRELALFCLRSGVVLQAGHTDAKYRNVLEGIQAGILHATHMFNAMRPLHHRDPGTVGAILIHDEMSCEIIADGHHVHPSVIKLLMQDKPTEKIVLITDALKPTMQETPPFFANGEEVCYKDGFFHRVKDDVIAGSALTMCKGVANLCRYGVSLQHAVQMATYNPARIMRFDRVGFLSPGNFADIVVFDEEFDIQYTVVRGAIAYDKHGTAQHKK